MHMSTFISPDKASVVVGQTRSALFNFFGPHAGERLHKKLESSSPLTIEERLLIRRALRVTSKK